jgi:hypothetical protein
VTSQVSARTPLLRLRKLCRAFPEVVEDPAGVGNPSFKVADRYSFSMRSTTMAMERRRFGARREMVLSWH